MNCTRPICSHTLWLMGAGWFLLALFVGETELLELLPRFAPQVIAATLTTLLLGSYLLLSPFRAGVNRLSDRALVAVHLTRLVGVYFLVQASRGQLDPRFAIPAGWGDIVVALGAAALLIFPLPRWALLIWNVLGLADILFVITRATTLRLADPAALDVFNRLPLSFLPTFIVPLIITTHVILFLRLLRRGASEEPGSGPVAFRSAAPLDQGDADFERTR